MDVDEMLGLSSTAKLLLNGRYAQKMGRNPQNVLRIGHWRLRCCGHGADCRYLAEICLVFMDKFLLTLKKISNAMTQALVLQLKRYDPYLKDSINLVLTARQGLDAQAFFDLTELSGYSKEQLAALFDLSLKTLNRYREERKKLSATSSELALKIMLLFRKGLEIFGAIETFKRWLEKPAFGLGGQLPFDLLHTSGGIDLIMDELTRIEYGDLA
jgi:putative toxin-antitoxin system antitoxin component (TIGR02293 family)